MAMAGGCSSSTIPGTRKNEETRMNFWRSTAPVKQLPWRDDEEAFSRWVQCHQMEVCKWRKRHTKENERFHRELDSMYDIHNAKYEKMATFMWKNEHEEMRAHSLLLQRICTSRGDAPRAMHVFRNMLLRGLHPNVLDVNMILDKLCKTDSIGVALRIYEGLDEKCEPDVVTFNTLIHGLCCSGRLEQALEVFKQMDDRWCVAKNSRTYAALIRGHCKFGKLEHAQMILRAMEGEPDLICYTNLIQGLCRTRRVSEACVLVDEMVSRGCKLDVVTCNVMVDGYCKAGRVEDAWEFIDRMLDVHGCHPDTVTLTTVVTGLCRTRRLGKALEMVLASERSLTSVGLYNVVISGLCRVERVEYAVEMVKLMVQRGYSPNLITYSTLMNGFCKQDRVEEAVEVLEGMILKGVSPNVVSYTTLVHAHCKKGRLEDAHEIVRRMLLRGIDPDLKTYTVLLDGYFSRGMGGRACEFFRDVVCKRCSPSVVTYATLVKGFCKTGMVNYAREFWKEMVVDRLMVPDVRTCEMFVEFLCHRGDHDAAYTALRDVLALCSDQDRKLKAVLESLLEDLRGKALIRWHYQETYMF